ncbi:MAG: TonB family protein [Bacteroidota bacterium]|jgi:protein TonB
MSANFFNHKNWNDVTDFGRNNIVFQNRNHEYGAFVIRRDYNQHLFWALLLSCALFTSAFLITAFITKQNAEEQIEVPTTDPVIITYDLTPPVMELKKEELPPPVEKIEKPAAAQNNTSMIASDDKTAVNVNTNDKIVNPSNTNTGGDTGTGDNSKTAGQTGEQTVVVNTEPVIYAEVMPVFPGGDEALLKYLQKNINYPPMAKENGVKGTVYVGFVIDANGKAVMLHIVRGVKGGKDLEEEAMRVIANMPAWSTGMHNGRPVAVKYNLPIKFDLR